MNYLSISWPNNKDKLLTVPLDKTFDTIIKRIQNEEPGLMSNLFKFSEELLPLVSSF